MKRLFTILILVICGNTFSQNPPTATEKVDIVSKSGKKLNFSEIKIESDASNSYKTLEIRYTPFKSLKMKEIVIDAKTYKCFTEKKEAIKYYYLVKKNAPKNVVYYVNSYAKKKPEIFTFRVNN